MQSCVGVSSASDNNVKDKDGDISLIQTEEVRVISQEFGNGWALYHGDSTEVLRGIPENTIHHICYSPPFSQLYTYSNSPNDLSNNKNDREFFNHFEFIVKELYRVLMPGRIMAVHCMNIPAMKERDGYIGLKDFRGDLIRLFQKNGFIWHSEHIIPKDPLIEATRTKALGLMHKQLMKDSCMCRAGLPDFLEAFRKPGENPERCNRPYGLEEYFGENGPIKGILSHERFRRWATTVWDDVRQTDTLQFRAARDGSDERHICPISLDVPRRAYQFWTNPGDTILTPFAGIGSEMYVAVEMGRRAVGIELKESYFKQALSNMRTVTKKNVGLFEVAS
jgi:DNA modification methylase